MSPGQQKEAHFSQQNIAGQFKLVLVAKQGGQDILGKVSFCNPIAFEVLE